MFNPFLAACQYQAALLDGWIRVASCACRMVVLQQQLLDRRCRYERVKNVAHRGPDLNDHYGRRARDVDVERI